MPSLFREQAYHRFPFFDYTNAPAFHTGLGRELEAQWTPIQLVFAGWLSQIHGLVSKNEIEGIELEMPGQLDLKVGTAITVDVPFDNCSPFAMA